MRRAIVKKWFEEVCAGHDSQICFVNWFHPNWHSHRAPIWRDSKCFDSWPHVRSSSQGGFRSGYAEESNLRAAQGPKSGQLLTASCVSLAQKS